MAFWLSGWTLPVIYTLATLVLFALPKHSWRIAQFATLLGLLTALSSAALALMLTLLERSALVPAQPAAGAGNALGITLSVLVGLLGWVITRYAARYLTGDAGQARFVRALLFTLACVGVLVSSLHLAVMVLAWSGTSIGLHYLLTHYRERKAAQIVAHKKWLVSRLAELCLIPALVLIHNATGTLYLPDLSAALAGFATLPDSLHAAMVLIALAVVLQTAQLPLHGWLIQVMEAPTPVSALLHAGVINIGGLVLIRLADLLNLAPLAQALLVLVGSVTAVLAGLVMMTRISIKVRLAWSTCAQMGFMLMEIGLGLYELALLHLVAHSLYKAYAFLNAGERVAEARQHDAYSRPLQHATPAWYLLSLGLTGMALISVLAFWQWLLPDLHLAPLVALIIAIGLAPLVWLEAAASVSELLRGLWRALALTHLYLLWHALFAGLVPASAAPAGWLVAWVAVCFAALYLVQIWLRCYPRGRLAIALFPWAYCGFYLDETFTRLTFKFWPARLTPRQAQTRVNRATELYGEMA